MNIDAYQFQINKEVKNLYETRTLNKFEKKIGSNEYL